MPGSGSPPEFLVDRSLGRHVVADALRAAGAVVRTLADVYGNDEETMADADWLARAGREGWVVLTKDARIRYRPAEIASVRAHGVQVFVVAGQHLPGRELAARCVHNLHRIGQAAQKPGPFIYMVYERRIERIWPKEDT